ncbi:MAG: NAD(P)/FAD-dependent oxidoreductase [Micrococcales bacterium]
MASRHRIAIVGAGIAGLTAAEQLRVGGYDGEIYLIGDESHRPYSRPTLSKQVLMDGWLEDEIALGSESKLEDMNIQHFPATEVLGLDTESRELSTEHENLRFDQLVIATGTRARTLSQAPQLPSLRTIEDAFFIRSALESARSVVVIGGGVLGSEIASAANAKGADVHLLARSASLTFGSLGEILSPELATLHEKNNVGVHFNSEVLKVEKNAHTTKVFLSNGTTIESDFVVTAIGSVPCVDWLRNSNLDMSNGVICDATGLAAPGIYAIGDVAAWPDPFSGIPTRTEHQSNAIEQAIAVANNIIHGTPPKAPIPFFWSEIHDARIKAYGWFNQPTLIREAHQESDGFLISNSKNNVTRGIVGWNVSPRAFNKSRVLVDQSV